MYRFKRPHRQFRVGDPVPGTYDAGIYRTMLDAHIIEPTPDEPELAKDVRDVPNKAILASGPGTKIRRK